MGNVSDLKFDRVKFKRKISKVGDSCFVTLPPELMRFVGLERGDDVEVMADEGKHGRFIAIWCPSKQKK